MNEVKFIITLSERAQLLAQTAAGIINECQKVTVTNDEQRGNILELVKQIKVTAKGLEDERMATTRPMDDAKKQVMDLYRQPLDNLNKAESVIKGAVIAYDNEVRRKAQELQRKLQAEAEEKARKEREKLEAQAAKAAAAGKEEKAAALIEKAEEVQVFVPIIQTTATKTAGVSSRTVWKARVVDPALVPRMFLIVDDSALQGYARATKGVNPVAGVQFYEEAVLSVRS